MPSIDVLFVYLGRRGLGDLVHDIADVLAARGTPWALALSREGEATPRLARHGEAIVQIPTFRRSLGALAPYRFLVARAALDAALDRLRPRAVVTLMPHVWSALLAPTLRQGGAKYISIVHDANRHPGDRTGLVHSLLMQDARYADIVVTLSTAVSLRLERSGVIPAERIITLFHPVTGRRHAVKVPRGAPAPGAPWRALFIGRIMAYKGLSLFVNAIERARAAGLPVELSVMGEGDLGPERACLERLGARIVNRWLTPEETAEAYATHDFVVLSHVEASQSGIAAAAMGAGVPVITTPVGGLVEQIKEEVTGLVASRVDADALAAAICRLATEQGLYARLAEGAARAVDGGVDRFVARLVDIALGRDLSVTGVLRPHA